MVSVRQGGYPEHDRGAEEGLGQGYYEVWIRSLKVEYVKADIKKRTRLTILPFSLIQSFSLFSLFKSFYLVIWTKSFIKLCCALYNTDRYTSIFDGLF